MGGVYDVLPAGRRLGHNLGLSEYRGAWTGDTNPVPELARQITELQSR